MPPPIADPPKRLTFVSWAACLFGLIAGCGYFRDLNTFEYLEHGYTFVLPGIEGESLFNSNIAQGLSNGGVDTAIEVHDWTTGTWLLFPVHLRDLERNRREAAELAGKIVEYQDRYPGLPVHLVGHSGGGGMALLTLEALPEGRQVTTVILLAPAVAPDYDLRPALAKTERGIWNFYSTLDAAYLIAGTTIAGTIDGKHSSSAGAIGFDKPADLSNDDAQAYEVKLHQVPYDWKMAASGNFGSHTGPTWIQFSRDYLAPIIRGQSASN